MNIENLNKLLNPVNDDTIFPFGKKYKGVKLKDVPADYLLWCLDNIDDLKTRYFGIYQYILNHADQLNDELSEKEEEDSFRRSIQRDE